MKTTHLHLLRSGSRLAGLSMLTAAAAAQAQVPAAAPEGVLNLSAQATVEAPQDWMTLVLSVTREGSDATQVQQQLKQAVEGAMAQARRQARPGQVELRSGAFSVYPRYGSKGGITGWQGSTELVIEGRDMPAIAQLSGQIGSLTISPAWATACRGRRARSCRPRPPPRPSPASGPRRATMPASSALAATRCARCR
ncbi:SIMPL domain-containing protein [Ideonella dechloratans]|uniref:SIMPL domain-containing protein n=1 Tax=Ideonella dechloratans TaxID=36863 RepID=UPI002873343E|nr:SIMPL domain-containing protein [Ideonella dechloratans]